MESLGFLGAGQMATAVVNGVLRAQLLSVHLPLPPPGPALLLTRPFALLLNRDAGRVWAYDVNAAPLDALAALGCQRAASASALVRAATVVVVAVKPDVVPAVLAEVRAALTPAHLVVSIAAGVDLKTLAALVPPGTRLVRVMPNTPCLVNQGASAIAPGPTATAADVAAVTRSDPAGRCGAALALKRALKRAGGWALKRALKRAGGWALKRAGGWALKRAGGRVGVVQRCNLHGRLRTLHRPRPHPPAVLWWSPTPDTRSPSARPPRFPAGCSRRRAWRSRRARRTWTPSRG